MATGKTGFNYKDKSSPKLTDEFKQKFSINIKGKDAIKLEGLTAFAHEKGMWKFETEVIQFPNDTNNWTAICRTTVGGYDWDPVKEAVREVIYTDIGDANVQNCTKMVAAAYIRMASTRSQARALRKYTNIDMVCSAEMDSVVDEQEPLITTGQLTKVKSLIKSKKITQEMFGQILFDMFQHTNYTQLTETQGNSLIDTIEAYVVPEAQQ